MSSHDQNCFEHNIYGIYLEKDLVVRFRKVQINVEGKEESAIAVYKFSNGIDAYRVGFRHLVKDWKQYDKFWPWSLTYTLKDLIVQQLENIYPWKWMLRRRYNFYFIKSSCRAIK